MFKFGEGVFGNDIKDSEIVQNEITIFDTDISVEDAIDFWNNQFETVPDFLLKDILDWNEDDFSFDIDLTDIDEILEMCFLGSGCSIKKNDFLMLKKSQSSKIPNLSFIYRRLKMIIKLFESLYIRKVRNTYLYLSSTVIP